MIKRQGTWVFLGQRDQFLDVFGRYLFVDAQDQGAFFDQNDGGNIFLNIVGDTIAHEGRVLLTRGPDCRYPMCSHRVWHAISLVPMTPPAPGLFFNDDIGAQFFGQLLAQHANTRIGKTTGGIRNDDRDRPFFRPLIGKKLREARPLQTC